MEQNRAGRSRFVRVCVFCGSSAGKRDCYRDAAAALGRELVARNVDLVYGGGSVGLMGLVSEAVHRGGGHVIGIIPRTLMRKEKAAETKKQWLLLAWQVGLLNVDGYYDFLLAFIDKAVNDGFIQPLQRHLVVSASNARDLVQKLEVMAAQPSSSFDLPVILRCMY
ncbi:hypothetical protein C4D60_Mb04t16340 [Musa balbisiana]|uniref:cytokinin riboside 5'-monophosphate phosphoribohydrolase n=1 Tax=Musa balbisiana TaxID=52838 RepID=A0A4S8KCG6_MUSBA|nr:hypothetical protein C4D60_Mb04t16340 [Musa balbisiana]